MDTVKWGHTPAMEADDILMSDNLLEFVKDEDIVNPDEILPQGNSIKPSFLGVAMPNVIHRVNKCVSIFFCFA